jgi:hypothetical protein
VQWYDSSAAARRAFCDQCGSRLAKEPRGSGRMLVSIGLFGPVTGLHVERHLYAAQHPDWYNVEVKEPA